MASPLRTIRAFSYIVFVSCLCFYLVAANMELTLVLKFLLTMALLVSTVGTLLIQNQTSGKSYPSYLILLTMSDNCSFIY